MSTLQMDGSGELILWHVHNEIGCLDIRGAVLGGSDAWRGAI